MTEHFIEYALKFLILALGFVAGWKGGALLRKIQALAVYVLLLFTQWRYELAEEKRNALDKPKDPP